MIRGLHRWPGLLALGIIMVLALSGAALSVFPAIEHLSAPQAEMDMSVGVLAERIQSAYPGVDQIRRAPSGRITAYWFDQGVPDAAVIDPATGKGVASADPNQVERWLTNLHRSLFLGDAGRIGMATGAAAMLVLALSGAILVARRAGGWRQWFAPLRGPFSSRLHVEVARVAVFGLAISSVTALWMTSSTFDLLPDGGTPPRFPTSVSGDSGIELAKLAMIGDVPVAKMRSLNFPYPGDATDVFTLKTDEGIGYLDQGTGELLSWTNLSWWERVSDTVYMLHTGQGAATFGLVLGLMVLGIPVMGVTGILIWLSGRRRRPGIRGNQPAGRAHTILLVGSESGSTWGFAATLHAALTEAGQRVHVASMSTFTPDRYARAERIIFLAATYGNGDAPASAKGFLDRLKTLDHAPEIPMAVLGFGDRSFPAYCAFAKAVAELAETKKWPELMPYDTVNRQSPQDFARWGQALGDVLGIKLELTHQPVLPQTDMLTLVSRRDYGAEVQAPAAILRFALPRSTLWQRLTGAGFSRFQAGDLIGILPEGSTMPRLYSLASSHRDGFIEIVVKKHPGGLCSGQLTALKTGETISAFLHRNPGFQPGKGHGPLLLIGAGTGIGPLAGFIRGNVGHRPIYLFFGMRNPDSDFFYSDEMQNWQADGRLSRLVLAVSRGTSPCYVQDALRKDAANVTRLIHDGARVMVCGGREMSAGVADALTDILAASVETPATLKAEGRYVEDIY
ncbi:PepSY domain-containing protein [Thalassospira sp. MCCC 1A01428]|jgi:sulfite reductase (NADPH) flavoprotein alpha-component|uniref:PepSY domain-containing protein n=1 Tax=Thalassospira sp. MCCC 1A01428 TaxID=1470575 RepID=UPI000A1E822D|nr:PepSY domain-containing protein [Thalassospira sp. MCCC 1A01428]OSQ38676.1 N-acetylglucosamine transferase [Thalassospira sp. MCCC 1A01428]